MFSHQAGLFTRSPLGLSSKFLLIQSLVLAAMVLVGAAGWWGMDQIGRRLQSVHADRVVPLIQLSDLADGYGPAAARTAADLSSGLDPLQALARLEEARAAGATAWAA